MAREGDDTNASTRHWRGAEISKSSSNNDLDMHRLPATSARGRGLVRALQVRDNAPPPDAPLNRELVLVIEGFDDTTPWETLVQELFDHPTVYVSCSNALSELYDRPRRSGELPWVTVLIGRPSTAASSLLVRGVQAHVHLKDVPVVIVTIDPEEPDAAAVHAAGAASVVRAAASDFPATLVRVTDYWLSVNLPKGRMKASPGGG